jgi:hypothetical protein
MVPVSKAPAMAPMGRTLESKLNKFTANGINKKVLITGLHVEFLATKVDDYDVTNCFFKMIDSDCMAKLKPLLTLNEDKVFKLPVWQTELNGEGFKQYQLKVKSKYVPGDADCIKGGLYTIDIEFVYYNMVVESESFKGYYSKIKFLKTNDSLVDISINN